jgi:hypothetical protein
MFLNNTRMLNRYIEIVNKVLIVVIMGKIYI